MQKKSQIIWSIQKKAVPLHAFLANPLNGAPENFNFWGEREHGENSYERIIDEVYLGENCKAIVANRIKP